jgi:hypothetical protein
MPEFAGTVTNILTIATIWISCNTCCLDEMSRSSAAHPLAATRYYFVAYQLVDVWAKPGFDG